MAAGDLVVPGNPRLTAIQREVQAIVRLCGAVNEAATVNAETVGPGLAPHERDDYEKRLYKAMDTLEIQARRSMYANSLRLAGKIEGIKLALDYLRAYDGGKGQEAVTTDRDAPASERDGR